MSIEMNKLIKQMIKYDLIGGFIFILIILLTVNVKSALIFSLGLIVSLINAIVSGVIIENSLQKGRSLLFPLSLFLRIAIILIIAFPFCSEFIEILSYMGGYISHFLFLLISIFKKNFKEGD